MKRLLFLIAVSCLLFSCEQDNYEKGEGSLSLMRADFVEAHTDAACNVDYVVTDEGDRLTIEGQLTAKWLTTPDSVYRAYLYYNKVGTMACDASIGAVGTMGIHTADFFKGRIMTDPVRFESAWLSTSRRYLNACIHLMVGNTSDEKAIHNLALLGDTLMHNPDSTRTWHLRLWHSQGTMPQYYSQRVFLSIPLTNIDADSIRLGINTYNGFVEKQFCIRYLQWVR